MLLFDDFAEMVTILKLAMILRSGRLLEITSIQIHLFVLNFEHITYMYLRYRINVKTRLVLKLMMHVYRSYKKQH